jgi:amino acid transporter
VFFYLICTVVTIDTIGAVASNGAQGFTWLIFLGVLFFLPYALSVAELGSAFPQEGGPYVWSRLAFGRPLAAINSVIYWISNPIWIGVATISRSPPSRSSSGRSGAPATCMRWFHLVHHGPRSCRCGTARVPTLGACARGGADVLRRVRRHLRGQARVPASAGTPSAHLCGVHRLVLVLFANHAAWRCPRRRARDDQSPGTCRSRCSGRARTVLAYGIPILAILIVLPASQVSGLTGFLDAVKATFTVYGGHVASDGSATLTGAGLILGRIAAIVFIFALASAGTTWIMGSDRTEAVAADDGGGPRVLGRFSARFGTRPR